MKLSGVRWVRSMNSVFGLCLCLVLICLTTAGAIAYTHQSYTGVRIAQAEPLQQNEVDYALSAVAGGPVIQVWKAAPLELATADAFAVYTFKVKRATDVTITEAGANIKNISNPTGAALNGTADGLPASAITTDASGQFVCTIVASNQDGTATKSLTLSLAKELLSTGQLPGESEETGGQTGQRTPQWGPLMRASITSPLSNIINKEPKFFKCPSDCDHCLKPDEAASKGYTQRCSEELCYYSPPENQKWFCYKPTPGWCCANGKVNPSTKDECDKIQGYWSTSQADATQACQPGCCCLSNGQISYPSTKAQCAQMYGTYYTDINMCRERCEPQGCCCVNGQMSYPVTQTQCNQMYGKYYTSLSQCKEDCKIATGCCCVNGQINYPSTQSQCSQMAGTYYTDLGQCKELCQSKCWCCFNGQLYETSQSWCSANGGTCYASQREGYIYCGKSSQDNTFTRPPTDYR